MLSSKQHELARLCGTLYVDHLKMYAYSDGQPPSQLLDFTTGFVLGVYCSNHEADPIPQNKVPDFLNAVRLNIDSEISINQTLNKIIKGK
jgi:hypothetical protein